MTHCRLMEGNGMDLSGVSDDDTTYDGSFLSPTSTDMSSAKDKIIQYRNCRIGFPFNACNTFPMFFFCFCVLLLFVFFINFCFFFIIFSSCVTDTCECPKGKRCECESFRAYARACAQNDIHINWEAEAPCAGTQTISNQIQCLLYILKTNQK